jgi:hypothetical protein
MTKSLSALFTMLKTAEVEIKNERTLLMVSKTVDYKNPRRKGKGNNGNFKKNGNDRAKVADLSVRRG